MPPRPNLVGACRSIVDRLHRQPPAKRIKMAFDLTNQLQEVQSEIAATRRGAVRELRAQGWTLAAIASEAGITVSRVKQIQDGVTNTKKYKPVVREPEVDPLADEYDN